MMHGFPGKQPGSYILYAEILHRKHNEEEQQQGKKQTKLKGKMVGIPFSREMAGFKMGCKIEDKNIYTAEIYCCCLRISAAAVGATIDDEC